MANSILASILSTPKLTIKNELTGAIQWQKLKVTRVEIEAEADIAMNPVSDSQINDKETFKAVLESDLKTAKIIRPSRIRITGFAPDVSMMNSIIQTFQDVESTLQVTSKSIITDSMVMSGLEVDQTPETLSAYGFVMELEQAIPPEDDTDYDPEQDGDRPTVGTRIQAPVSSAQTVEGLYSRVSGVASDAIGRITNLF